MSDTMLLIVAIVAVSYLWNALNANRLLPKIGAASVPTS